MQLTSFIYVFHCVASQALSNQLRSVSLRIVPDQVCDIYNYEYLYFTPTNICVDGTYGSSCGGDSGSGMHMTLNGRLSLIGVVSYGTATCEDGHPVAMTRVTSYLDWIASNTGLRI
jgi:chymotrypsin